MHSLTMSPCWCLVLALSAGVANANAAELGDYNGDGCVSAADAYFFGAWHRRLWPIPPVDGAGDFNRHFSCDSLHTTSKLPRIIFQEALRRLSDSPLPHFIEPWPEPGVPPAVPPPVDDRVTAEIRPLVHSGGRGSLDLEVRLTALVPVDFAAFVFRSESLDLRPRIERYVRQSVQNITTEYYLVSGGLLSYHSGFDGPRSWEPSERVITVPVEIPSGTPAGIYTVEVADGTEVVTPFGAVLRPRAVPGTLEIEEEITSGPELPFPPLEFDLDAGTIKGAVEMRLADAEGFPGDIVETTLQVRPWRPVNWMRIRMPVDRRALRVLDLEPLYPDPTLGEVRDEEYQYTASGGEANLIYKAEDSLPAPYDYDSHQASLRYLAPIGEWLDIARLTVEILGNAAGSGEVEVGLDLDVFSNSGALFLPYLPAEPIPGVECRSRGAFEYEPILKTPGRVTILGGGEPPPPPPPPIDPEVAGITFDLGGASGEPGEEVSVPVFMEAAVELHQLRLVLGYDPSQLDLVGFEMAFEDADGQPGRKLLHPGDGEWGFLNRACETPPGADRPRCRVGFPLLGTLHGEWARDELPDGVVLVDISAPFQTAEVEKQVPTVWTPDTRYEVGNVRFRVRKEARAGAVEIAGVAVNWKPSYSIVELPEETSGYPVLDPPPEERADVPAFEVLSGTVTITSERALFIRGDTDLSGDIVITDPVRTFRTLFQGDPPLPCDDSADANDDGAVDITDAIYTLQWLFVGGPEPPPPYPVAGLDTTEDALDCAES